jgi:hypothetical protein
MTLNPVELALLTRCASWLTREELVAELTSLTDAETVERTISFLVRRQLLEPLATSERAFGATTYHATLLGARTLRRHWRRAAGMPRPERRLRVVR